MGVIHMAREVWVWHMLVVLLGNYRHGTHGCGC